jgi:hypothetical protein
VERAKTNLSSDVGTSTYQNFAFAFLSREISDTFRSKNIVLRSYIEIEPRRICKIFEFLCDTLPV